jgi:hypothetical protein
VEVVGRAGAGEGRQALGDAVWRQDRQRVAARLAVPEQIEQRQHVETVVAVDVGQHEGRGRGDG